MATACAVVAEGNGLSKISENAGAAAVMPARKRQAKKGFSVG